MVKQMTHAVQKQHRLSGPSPSLQLTLEPSKSADFAIHICRAGSLTWGKLSSKMTKSDGAQQEAKQPLCSLGRADRFSRQARLERDFRVFPGKVDPVFRPETRQNNNLGSGFDSIKT